MRLGMAGPEPHLFLCHVVWHYVRFGILRRVVFLFSQNFHRILLRFTVSAQFILRFALSSLMLGERMLQSSVRKHGDH